MAVALAESEPKADSDPYYGYYGYPYYGYGYRGYYGRGYGYYGRKKRSAESDAVSAPEPTAVADSDAESDADALYG